MESLGGDDAEARPEPVPRSVHKWVQGGAEARARPAYGAEPAGSRPTLHHAVSSAGHRQLHVDAEVIRPAL